MQQSMLNDNDMPLHKFIPMETLDLIQPNQVKILYYQNPSRFYVYLRQKINSHAQFQVELQRAMQNYQSVSSSVKYQRYQPVVAQDNHAVWHRATILDVNPNSSEIRVYFVDVGQQENISITNIRPLPHEFTRQPAFAIPCRLYQIFPRSGNDQSTWQSYDPVHDEFNRLMANIGSCKVCNIQEQLCYDVEIELPQVGDLGTFLLGKNLVSRITMRSSQATIYNANQPPPLQQQTFGRPPPGLPGIPSSMPQQRSIQTNEYYSNTVQQQPTPLLTSGLQKPVVQQVPSKPTSNTDSSSNICTVPPQNGHYTITQVYSAVEFYGHSQVRERELEAFHKHLEVIYNNNNTNDQSLSVHFLMEGVQCAIQQGDKYHRVIIKRRESESRVSVKLIDRGDEIIVDTSELLQLEAKYLTIPAFAQPFRLHDYDESQSTANITRKLKRLILNQRVQVQINQHLPMINGFYPVEVKLSDGQSVNQVLLSNDNIQLISPPTRTVEVSTFNSSLKPQQDMNIQRSNDDLPAPQKILTATTSERTQPGRFGQTPPIVNEQSSRFSRPQQSEESNNTQRSFEQNSSRITNGTSQNRFNDNQQSTTDQARPYSGGFTSDEQRNGNNRDGGFADRAGRNVGRNNEENNNENGPQRSGFTNRGGFAERGGRYGGSQDRNGGNRNNQDDGNNENNGNQRSQGFASRGGFNADRGNRNGGSQNYRDRDEDKEGGGGFARRGGFGGDRGGSRGDRGGFGDRGARDGGSFGDRGGRGGGSFGDRGGRGGGSFGDRGGRGGGGGFGDRGSRGGGFSDRGARGGGSFGDRGGRSNGFGDRDDSGFRSNSDNNDTMKTFSGWPNVKAPISKFEAGDKFLDNEIPKEIFQFVLSHIEKVNDFFIQLLSKGDELSKLTDTLQTECKEAPEFLNFSSIKVNQACLAKSSDNCWYRAIVLSTSITKIKVRFIDFGDTIDVDTKTIRQLAKKFCSPSPYAYHCTLKNVEANENINTDNIIDKCAGKTFDGKLEKQSSDTEYLLQSDNFEKLLIEINAIKIKSQDLSATHLKCLIVYNDSDKHQFYIQDDDERMQKITDLIHGELINAKEVPLDDIKIDSMVISMFDEAPYRAVIQSDLNDNVDVYFIDFGNSNTCLKSSLKQCSEQLQAYSYQAKRCQLYGVEINHLDEAFKELHEYIESDKVDIVIMNQNDDEFDVLVYIDGECFNKKFGYDDKHEIDIDMDDQSSIATTTTVQEQERPASATGKRNNEEILSPVGNSSSASTNIKRKKSESETEAIPIKHLQGALTYIDKTKPFVYLQLIPESEPIIDRINKLIDSIIEEDKHNSSYEIGDNIIAKFSDDNTPYRARIRSYSSSKQTYTVYFLDYGNIDENVPIDHLYSYSPELEQIKPQAHGYNLENLTRQTWINTVRSIFDEKLNDTIDFYFIDESKSIIHIKLDNENEIYNNNNKPKTFTANISGTNKDCFYIHILPDADSQILEMDEILQTLEEKQHKIDDTWSIDDLCIVFNKEENEYFRGKILSINNDKYDVQCIDYGNVINDLINEDLYLLPDESLLKQLPLARQCRLYGVSEKNQIKAIDEVIKNISQTEPVTITVENDQNDQCMFVMLFRENNEIVNDQYQSDQDIKKESTTDKKDDIPVADSSDSAIAADNDTSNDDGQLSSNDQQLTSPIGIPQAESTHQYGDTANNTVSNSSPSSSSITINQTIDFGENDPSTSNTTIKDDSENLSLD